jgi:hypothetical protein
MSVRQSVVSCIAIRRISTLCVFLFASFGSVASRLAASAFGGAQQGTLRAATDRLSTCSSRSVTLFSMRKMSINSCENICAMVLYRLQLCQRHSQHCARGALSCATAKE